jgi:hypothetical protein
MTVTGLVALLAVLVVASAFTAPVYAYSRRWGWGPSLGLTLLAAAALAALVTHLWRGE